MSEWTNYLIELKTKAESEELKFFVSKSLMMRKISEIFDSYGRDHFSYYIVPQITKESIINGDYLLLFRNHKVAKVVLSTEPYDKCLFTKDNLNKIKNTFQEPLPIDLLLFIWDDPKYHALTFEPYHIVNFERGETILPQPLSYVLDNYFKLPASKLEKIEQKKVFKYPERRAVEDLKHYLLESFDEYKTKHFHSPNKEAIESINTDKLKEVLVYIEDILDKEIDENEFVLKLKEIFRLFDKND